jgi:hypothetical protein
MTHPLTAVSSSLPKFVAPVADSYKLSASLAPLSCYEPNAPLLTPDHHHNLRIPDFHGIGRNATVKHLVVAHPSQVSSCPSGPRFSISLTSRCLQS